MDEDFVLIGSTSNILAEFSSDENNHSSAVPRGTTTDPSSGKRGLKRSKALEGVRVEQVHTNPAFELGDEFVIVDVMGSSLTRPRGNDTEEDLIDDTRPPSPSPSPTVGGVDAFQMKPHKPVLNKQDKLDPWTIQTSDRTRRALVRGDSLEVKVVDPSLPMKLSHVLSPKDHSTHRDEGQDSSKHKSSREAPLTLSPFKLLSEPNAPANDENTNQSSYIRKRPLWASRMAFRSEDIPDGRDGRTQTESFALTLRHTQSLRVPNTRTQSAADTVQSKTGKSRRLLRDLSFSDADAKTIQDYGTLKTVNTIPERTQESAPSLEDEDALFDENKHLVIPEEVLRPLKQLMEELVRRGKVREVAVVEQQACRMISSHPKWTLSESYSSGVVKAVMGSQQMLKLSLDGEVYTCFKHGPQKLVARSGDNILVAQRTEVFVLVAHALDDTPGSCLYEVSQLANVLSAKGW